MRFTPVSEEEAAAVNLLPKGDYDAVVQSAVDKTSKTSGNEMIELTLTVYGDDSKERKVRDWLVSTDGGQAKIQRFCKSAGLWDMYQSGELSADCCGNVNVRVKIGQQPGEGDYPPKNKVVDYLPPKASVRPASSLQGVPPTQTRAAGTGRSDPTAPPTQDEIPF
jgi:hypothetical protein